MDEPDPRLPEEDTTTEPTAPTAPTAKEQREGEPLEDRLDREEPEGQERGTRRAGRLIEEGEGLTDREKDEVSEEATDDVEGLTAEEAAVRVDEDAGGGVDRDRDRYVEEP